MLEKTIKIMGGDLIINISAKNTLIENEIINFIIENIITLVNIFNFYDKKSNLSQLNINHVIKTNKNLKFLLEKSQYFYKISNGRFNVFNGELIKNRKEDIESKKNNILIENIDKILKFTKQDIQLINENIIIDLGGIAKGYIIDEVMRLTLNQYKKHIKNLLINARGDIIIYGKDEVIIEIENPLNNKTIFDFIKLKKGVVITSGHNKQYFKQGSHIVGEQKDILTITLVSQIRKCYELDALGTFLIQLSSHKALKILEFNIIFEDIEALLVLNNGKVLKTSFWEVYKNG